MKRFSFFALVVLFFVACNKDKQTAFLLQGATWDVYSAKVGGEEVLGVDFMAITFSFSNYEKRQHTGYYRATFRDMNDEEAVFSGRYWVEDAGTTLVLSNSHSLEEMYELSLSNYELEMRFPPTDNLQEIVFKAKRN